MANKIDARKSVRYIFLNTHTGATLDKTNLFLQAITEAARYTEPHLEGA